MRWTIARIHSKRCPGQVHRPHGVYSGRARPGKPADVKLFVNGKETGKGRVAKTVPFRYSVEPFDVGRDTVSPVSEDYKALFAFQGRIEHVTVEVKPQGAAGRALQ